MFAIICVFTDETAVFSMLRYEKRPMKPRFFCIIPCRVWRTLPWGFGVPDTFFRITSQSLALHRRLTYVTPSWAVGNVSWLKQPIFRARNAVVTLLLENKIRFGWQRFDVAGGGEDSAVYVCVTHREEQ